MASSKPKPVSQKSVAFNIRMDPALRKRIRIWCAENDREMTALTIQLLTDFLDSQPPKAKTVTATP